MSYRKRSAKSPRSAQGSDDFHEWVLSLPWVVERPASAGTPPIRSFGVDCAPLDRRQLWLVTGLPAETEKGGDDLGLALIVPDDVAREIESAQYGDVLAPMPAEHAMVTVRGDLERVHIDTFVLTAYCCAMS